MKQILSRIRVARRVGLAIYCSISASGVALAQKTAEANAPRVEQDGTIHVPAFLLPESFLSEETRRELKDSRDLAAAPKTCPSEPAWGDGTEEAKPVDMPAIRKCQAEAFYKTRRYKKLRDRYEVEMTLEEIGGVYAEVFTPTQGVARKKEQTCAHQRARWRIYGWLTPDQSPGVYTDCIRRQDQGLASSA